MSFDVLLCIICGGFMCICGGFGTYGCYRCFTDKAGEKSSRIHSEYSIRKLSNKTRLNLGLNPRLKSPSNSSLSTSFNGTIYTINSSEGSMLEGFHDRKIPNQILKNNHDYQLSINPNLITWKLPQDNGRKTKTAPI